MGAAGLDTSPKNAENRRKMMVTVDRRTMLATCRGRRSCQAHFTKSAYSACFSRYAFTNGHLRDRLQPIGPHLVERALGQHTDPLAPDQFFKESVSMLRIDQASPSLAPPISSIFHCPLSRTRL